MIRNMRSEKTRKQEERAPEKPMMLAVLVMLFIDTVDQKAIWKSRKQVKTIEWI